MVRQGHFKAVVGVILIGCAVLLVVVGCAGVRSGAPQEEQKRSPQATSEEARCERTSTFEQSRMVFTTNDLPGCPNKGGLLSGTDGRDKLDGNMGDDEIRGLGARDELIRGLGSDVLYGGPGDDLLNLYVVHGKTAE